MKNSMISCVLLPMMAVTIMGTDHVSAKEPERLWMAAAWQQWLPDATAARNYADAAVKRGLNGVGMSIPWARIEPEPGKFDFSWIDERLDIFVDAGLRVHLRMDCSRELPKWFDPVFMETPDGKVYAHQEKLRVISFADPKVMDAVPRVMGAVAAHVWPRYADRGDPHPVTSIHPMFSPPLETEYAFTDWSDFSPPAQSDFRDWLRERHGEIGVLNERWGTHLAEWEQVTLQAAPPYDFHSYRTAALARLIDRCAEEVHKTPEANLAVQFGSVWDGLSPYRGCRDVARLARNADWVIVDDSPVFPFDFSMDYLRGMCRDKVWVNEIDGPWNPYLTNEKSVEQGVVSLRRGAHHLWAANWTAQALLDPKYTFWEPILEELRKPRPEVKPKKAIFVSLATIYRQEGGKSVNETVGGYYNNLSNSGEEPIDFISDTVLLEHPEWMEQYTEGIFVPGSQLWMTGEVVEALSKLGAQVKPESALAGALDEYGEIGERLMVVY